MVATVKTHIVGIILLSLSLGWTTGVSARQQHPGKLTVSGSSTMAPLVAEMARRYEHKHPHVSIKVLASSSGRGLSDARNGLSQIGMVSRLLQEDEKDLKSFPVAVDAISFIVSSGNRVKFISKVQLAGIFSGRITNWKELGGRDEAIKVVLRDDSRSSTKLVAEFLHISVPQMKGTIIPADSSATIKAVGKLSNVIGYVSFGEAYPYSGKNGKIKMLVLDRQPPTKVSILNGSYPLIRVLNLVTKGEPGPLAADFIRYCRSKAVSDLVTTYDFLNLEL